MRLACRITKAKMQTRIVFDCFVTGEFRLIT